MDETTKPRLDLQWQNRELRWMAWTEKECLVVDANIFQRFLKQEFEKRGVEWKTWHDYMEEAK